MASKRQRIVAAIVARMKLINGTGDYVTDIADRAEDSRMNWDESEMPAISVFDMEAVVTPTSLGTSRNSSMHDMDVLIKAFCKRGTDASDARQLLADIQTAIRQDLDWKDADGTISLGTWQTSDEVTRSQESFEIDGCTQTIKVRFLTQIFNAST